MSKQKQRAIDSLIGDLVSMYPDDPLVAKERTELEARNPALANAIRPYKSGQRLFQHIEPLLDKSPFALDDLLSESPRNRIREIMAFKRTGYGEENRDGLLNALCLAADQNTQWGIDLLAALLEQGEKENDIWQRVLWKLKWPKLSSPQRHWLLDHFDTDHKYGDDFLNGYAHLVLANGFPGSDEPVDSSLLEKQLKLTFHLWKQTKDAPGFKVNVPYQENDWIFEAINRPPGHCCLFWLKYTELLQKKDPDTERLWPAAIESRMNEIIRGESKGEILGLALLGQYLGSVRYMVPKWTKQKLYPCFDFETRNERAYPPWLGFSGYGHLSRELAAEMPYLFQSAFPHMSSFKENLADRFTGLVAAIAVSPDPKFKRTDWLQAFHRSATEKLERKWLAHLSHFLKGTRPQDKQLVWNGWLREYWKGRINGVPRPISVAETPAFYKLALALGQLAHQAVPLLDPLPNPEKQWSHVFLDFDKNTLFDEDPVALVRIVAWWLRQVKSLIAGPNEIAAFVNRLPNSTDLIPGLNQIEDELTRLRPDYVLGFREAVSNKFAKTTN